MPTVARIVGNLDAHVYIEEFLNAKKWRAIKIEPKGSHLEIRCHKGFGPDRIEMHMRISELSPGNTFLTCFSLTTKITIMSPDFFLGQWEYDSAEEIDEKMLPMHFHPLASSEVLISEVFGMYDEMAGNLNQPTLFR